MGTPVLPRPDVLFEDTNAVAAAMMVVLGDQLLVAATVDGHDPPVGKRWGINFTRPGQGHVEPYSGVIAGGPIAWGKTRLEIDIAGFALPTQDTTPGAMAVGEIALQAASGGNQWIKCDVWSGTLDPDTGAKVMIEPDAGNVWAYRINGANGLVRQVSAAAAVQKVVGRYVTILQS